jgi:hypothetical protein
MNDRLRKVYLGDGAYAQYDGFAITLTTSNGMRDTNTIVLEPEVQKAFWRYMLTIVAETEEKAEEDPYVHEE